MILKKNVPFRRQSYAIESTFDEDWNNKCQTEYKLSCLITKFDALLECVQY